MDKPTYEELERALVIMTVTGAVAVGGEEFIQEPALGFFNSLTDDDLEKKKPRKLSTPCSRSSSRPRCRED